MVGCFNNCVYYTYFYSEVWIIRLPVVILLFFIQVISCIPVVIILLVLYVGVFPSCGCETLVCRPRSGPAVKKLWLIAWLSVLALSITSAHASPCSGDVGIGVCLTIS